MTHPQAFLYLCISFILGIFIGSFFYSIHLIYLLLIFSLSVVSILWKKENVIFVFLLILFFILGYVYVNYSTKNILENEATLSFDKEICLEGKVLGIPR